MLRDVIIDDVALEVMIDLRRHGHCENLIVRFDGRTRVVLVCGDREGDELSTFASRSAHDEQFGLIHGKVAPVALAGVGIESQTETAKDKLLLVIAVVNKLPGHVPALQALTNNDGDGIPAGNPPPLAGHLSPLHHYGNR